MFGIFHEKYIELKARRQTRLDEWQGGPDSVLWFFVMSDHRESEEKKLIEAPLFHCFCFRFINSQTSRLNASYRLSPPSLGARQLPFKLFSTPFNASLFLSGRQN